MAYNLKYILEFNDPLNNLCRTEIYQESDLPFLPVYLEGAEDPVMLEVEETDNIYQPLVGSGLTLRLIATTDFTLDDLYTENERQFQVKHYRNGELHFFGYIIPDGAKQSFVHDVWVVELTCVDGLGILKNMAFVNDTTGFDFSGRMSYLNVIVNCLTRTRLGMNINTSVNIFYNGLLVNDTQNPNDFDGLALPMINVERFAQDDEDEPMSCYEVLESVLVTFKACLMQRGGEWFIIRYNELTNNSNISFRRYNQSGSRLTNQTINLGVQLGAFSAGYNIHHANNNQIVYLEKAYKKLTINYKYGIALSLVSNPSFVGYNTGMSAPPGWTKVGNFNMYPDENGVGVNENFDYGRFLHSTPITVSQGDLLTFIMTVRTRNAGTQGQVAVTMFLDGAAGNDYFLDYSGGAYSWKLLGTRDAIPYFANYEGVTYEDELPPVPVSGQLRIELYGDDSTDNPAYIYKQAKLIPSDTSKQPVKGEFHTVQQLGKYSHVPDNEEVYNGDGLSDIFVGTIYKADGITPTNLWHRLGESARQPIVGVAALDTLRMFQRQRRKFTGDYFSYFHYLSVVEIIGIPGKFVPNSLVFDYARNTGSIVLREIIDAPMEGVTYNVTLDYGQTVKPVIRY